MTVSRAQWGKKMLLLWRIGLDASSFVCHLFIATVIQGRGGGFLEEGRYCIDMCFSFDTVQFLVSFQQIVEL